MTSRRPSGRRPALRSAPLSAVAPCLSVAGPSCAVADEAWAEDLTLAAAAGSMAGPGTNSIDPTPDTVDEVTGGTRSVFCTSAAPNLFAAGDTSSAGKDALPGLPETGGWSREVAHGAIRGLGMAGTCGRTNRIVGTVRLGQAAGSGWTWPVRRT